MHIIELKRDRTPRDVVAQALDYASWVRGLHYEDIVVRVQELTGVYADRLPREFVVDSSPLKVFEVRDVVA